MAAKSYAPIPLFNNYMTIGSNVDNQMKVFYTPDELAACFAISKATIYRLVNKRQLPSSKIGGVLRFNKDDIDRYLETVRIEPIKL